MDTLRIEQWPVRRQILDMLLDILADGQPRQARQLTDLLAKKGLKVSKKLVNSVLFSEGRRYVVYDHAIWTYSLRPDDGKSPAVDVVQTVDAEQQPASPQIQVRYLGRDEQYVIQSGSSSGPSFFEVEARGATVHLNLNQDHPLYPTLLSALFESEELAVDEAAGECLSLVLAAWSRYENDEPEGTRKQRAQDTRADWGRAARDLLNEL